jgi:hypothetical protein
MSDVLSYNKIRRWLYGAVLFLVIALLAGIQLVFFYPGTLGSKKEAISYGSGDFTLDMYGWEKSGSQMASFIKHQHLTEIPLYSHQWFPAAHLDEYLSRKSGNRLFAVGPLEQIHQYKWINERRGGLPASDSALFVIPSNNYRDPYQLYGKEFQSIQLLKTIPQYRKGHLTRYFYLYLMCKRNRRSF